MKVLYSVFYQCEELPCCCRGQLITKQDLSQFNILLNIQSKPCRWAIPQLQLSTCAARETLLPWLESERTLTPMISFSIQQWH